MSKSIRLHKEYGLNPTIAQCIVCGKDKNEIALLGASYKEQAPMKMVINVEPCDECKEKYLKVGVLLVEADRDVVGGKERMRPTGKVVVLKDEAFARIFNKPLPPRKVCFVEIGLLDKLASMERGDNRGQEEPDNSGK